MGLIEKYYGVEESKKLTENKLGKRSKKYLARLEESHLLKEANGLFVKGNSLQCFDVLQKAITLVPNDFRPYYMLGLIHEENGRYEKASMSYIAAAILKRNDTSLWKKALNCALQTTNQKNQILALEKLFRREPSENILLRKLEILRQMRKKYSVIACQIELFDYHGVNEGIFDEFESTNHINSLRKISSSLFRCIKNNPTARTEYFLRRTIFILFKIVDWTRILKILDEHYLKEDQKIHPDIRFVYIIAVLYSRSCRFDDLLSIGKLIEDPYVWREAENLDYAYRLCECLKDCGDIPNAIKVAEKLLKVTGSTRALHTLGDLHMSQGNHQSAIGYYNEIIDLDPTEEEAKTKLYEIYESLGYSSLAEKFETPMRVTEYIKELGDTRKSEFRYSSDKCKEMREIYENLHRISSNDRGSFLESAKILLDDFFENPFVITRNRNFRSFVNRHEIPIVEDELSLVVCDESLSKKQMSDILIRISSLHGLDIDEWFFVIKNTIISLIILGRYEEALEMVEKSIEVHLFRSGAYLIQLVFLGIRLYLMAEDIDGVVGMTKVLIWGYNYTSMYLLYFLTFILPDFHKNKSFCSLQKNIQRIMRRSFEENSGEWATVSTFLGVNSFIPRFLRTETVDFVISKINSQRPDVNILKSVICIAHSKSRTLLDKKKYATEGIKCLRGIPDDGIKVYNLAKAYHFFGFYTHAEILYLQAIETGTEDIRKMSVFNLSLIFRENKSRKVIEALLTKCAG